MNPWLAQTLEGVMQSWVLGVAQLGEVGESRVGVWFVVSWWPYLFSQGFPQSSVLSSDSFFIHLQTAV